MTFAGWPVNQRASGRFGTQHSQAIAAYAVLKEKFDDPGRGELAVDRDPSATQVRQSSLNPNAERRMRQISFLDVGAGPLGGAVSGGAGGSTPSCWRRLRLSISRRRSLPFAVDNAVDENRLPRLWIFRWLGFHHHIARR